LKGAEMEIRESQIEDVLVNAPRLAQTILRLDEEPRLIVRQMPVPSGRLDLLYAYRTKLLLVELKIVPFQQKFLGQVLNYKLDLVRYQEGGKLVRGEVIPYLLCPFVSDAHKEIAEAKGVNCENYRPEEVLQFFYENFKPIASFVEIKPMDFGIWNLHLIHEFIYMLEEITSIKELQHLVSGSPKSLANKIRFASSLGLLHWEVRKDIIHLSAMGKKYVHLKDEIYPGKLSEAQVQLMRDFVMRNPHETPITLGIASMVEAVFALSKNTYPVPMSHLMQYFSYHSGKHFDWKTDKAKFNATRMYSNYSIDLGLLAKSGDSIYLTPEGFRFTVQMQLHKSLKMMESMKVV
jgi:hypothetical protein